MHTPMHAHMHMQYNYRNTKTYHITPHGWLDSTSYLSLVEPETSSEFTELEAKLLLTAILTISLSTFNYKTSTV